MLKEEGREHPFQAQQREGLSFENPPSPRRAEKGDVLLARVGMELKLDACGEFELWRKFHDGESG